MKVAHLARLELTEEEIKKFQPQLAGLLEMANMLNEVDTRHVEPIAQITSLQNVTFDDHVQTFPKTEELLAQSPQEKQDHMIKVKNIF